MRFFAFITALLLLIAIPFSLQYSKEAVFENWLEVKRTVYANASGGCALQIPGVSTACSNTGAVQPLSATHVVISLRNIGQFDRHGILLTESLSHVPNGVKVEFLSSPAMTDGKQAVWNISAIKAGQSLNISYIIRTRISQSAAERIPDPIIAADPLSVIMAVPSQAKVNDTLTVVLKTSEGVPVPGAKISIIYPDGSRHYLRTNSSGSASFVALQEGTYTFYAEGFKLGSPSISSLVEKVQEQSNQAETAASLFDFGLISNNLLSLLPIFAGVFVFFLLILVAYSFVTSRKEQYAEEPAPAAAAGSPAQSQSQQYPVYSQTFTFSEPQSKEIEGATKEMLEERKKKLQEDVQKAAEERVKEPAEKKSTADESVSEGGEASPATTTSALGESAVIKDELDSQLDELERNAKIASEVAQQEKEVESMLVQLERIRERLRASRQEAQPSKQEEEEEEEEKGEHKQAPPPKPRKQQHAAAVQKPQKKLKAKEKKPDKRKR